MPAHSTLLRNREKDSAPHLAPGESSKHFLSHTAKPCTTERDNQQRASLKKRNGETDDWRRGAHSYKVTMIHADFASGSEATRNGRDERK